jgi:hypothetical protein
VNVPGVSKELAIEITPFRELRPYVGLKPTIPHILAGCLIDQPVSVQSAAGIIPAATAAADPEEDPPGIRVVSHGFLVILIALFSPLPPIANSSILSFPILENPATCRRDIIVAL